MIVDDQRDAAAAMLDDRSGAYAGYALAADFLALREIYAGYLGRVADESWGRRTERRPTGWTLLETLAHLEVVAQVFNYSFELAMAGQPIVIPALPRRTDLPEANRIMIAEGVKRGPRELTAAFLDTLDRGARLASGLGPANFAETVSAPYYGGRGAICEILGASLSHAGVVHGAQVAVGARAQPIWSFYSPGLMRRQLTRTFHTMGLAYWPERGGDLHAVFAFHVAGQGGGSWFIRVGPDGGRGSIGSVRTADVTMRFASADLLCRALTLQPGLLPSLLLRRVRVSGNLRLAARIPHLFSPT